MIYTIAIKLSIFLYEPDFRSYEKIFEFWVLFDMYTCILATKFGYVRLVSFTIVHDREAYDTVLSRS